MSVIGSMLGLRCAAHARTSPKPDAWLATGAVALGGAGIWVMHFTAMLGFSIHGATIRYDGVVTLLSAAISIVVVWIGLSIAVRAARKAVAIPLGGLVTGTGVAVMHYLGMYAMHTSAHIEYRFPLVALSFAIAVVAATVALWFAVTVRGLRASLSAALVMGLAVCGMHYTGMSAMRAHMSADMSPPEGSQAVQLVTPLFVSVIIVTMALMLVVGLAEVDERSKSEG
ncbi:MHYT domain-containing protein [Nocardia sp. NPDC059240]|uniref:MHYT domain-containing protein n=1 Tax=Nocardia sp. NPDC059240 TaxID=3346786 RepID=UPI0036981FF9